MNRQETDNLSRGGFPDGPLSRAAVLRAAADGELTPEQFESVRDDTFERGLAFERGLREATARAMGVVSTPAGLRDRVAAAADEARCAEDTDLADRLEDRAQQTRQPSFWADQRRLIGALAAVLVLTVAGVFVTRFARLSQQTDMLAYRTNLATFVSGEHTRTLDDEVARQKYTYTAVDAAVEGLGGRLRGTPVVPPCRGKTAFRGASPCGVPGRGPSCHFQYLVALDDGSFSTVSIFVKQDNGELSLDEGAAYRIRTDECDLAGFHICVWRRDGLLYTMVSDQCHATLCGGLLDDLGVTRPDADHEL